MKNAVFTILLMFLTINLANATNIYNENGCKIGSYQTNGNKTTYKNKNGNRIGYSIEKEKYTYYYNNSGQLQYKTKK